MSLKQQNQQLKNKLNGQKDIFQLIQAQEEEQKEEINTKNSRKSKKQARNR